jgi:hypothetical protein
MPAVTAKAGSTVTLRTRRKAPFALVRIDFGTSDESGTNAAAIDGYAHTEHRARECARLANGRCSPRRKYEHKPITDGKVEVQV